MKITIIGSGNVATHLAKKFFEQGCVIVQIYSRKAINAQMLAQQVNAQAITEIQQLLPADLYIIAVTDTAIVEVTELLNQNNANAVVAHTSGSINMTVLHKFVNHGVLYPLQTFNKLRTTINWIQIPIFIEANNNNTLQYLQVCAKKLSPDVHIADSNSRRQLHVAAVFACNFVNYLLAVAKNISAADFPFLYPLVRETIEKAFSATHPQAVQTGPAARHDNVTIAIQRAMLPDGVQQLYDELSLRIMEQMKNPYKI